jgi:polyhydroxyalkanoate synthesis regulator phasin
MKRKTTLEKLQYQKKELEYSVNKLQEVVDYLENQIKELKEFGKNYLATFVYKGLSSAYTKMDRQSSRINELDREIKSLSSLDQ